MPADTSSELAARIANAVALHEPELIDLRRDLHAHPELSWQEYRTTELVGERLEKAGWAVRRLPATGVIAELGEGRMVALRADLDALPVDDDTEDAWTSTVSGVAHACGHDVHTTCVVGAGLALAELHREGLLPGRVRLILQPAEEVMPGGALHLMSLGALDDVERIFALHCDPGVDGGQVALSRRTSPWSRTGPPTSPSPSRRSPPSCRASSPAGWIPEPG